MPNAIRCLNIEAGGTEGRELPQPLSALLIFVPSLHPNRHNVNGGMIFFSSKTRLPK